VDVVDWSQLSEEFRSVILSQKAVIQAPGEGGQKRREERAWKTVPLKECVDVLTGGTPQRSNPAYWNGDIPWAAPQDLGPLQLRDTADHVTPAAIGHGTRLAPEGAVLILVRGATLSREVPVCITRRPMAFHQNIRALLPRPGVLADYLAYFLLANQAALSTLVQGTSRGTGQINSAALASFPLAVPPSSEQQALARILLALDDKMELNRRMNETLESLARAVFKSWLES
jgi:type I restriction enzyme S subunit